VEAETAVRINAGAYEAFQDAWSANPWEPRYADHAGQVRLRFPVDLFNEDALDAAELEAVRQQYGSVLVWLDRGLEAQPRDPFLWASRGEAYSRLYGLTQEEEHRSEAIESLERSLELNPWLVDTARLLVQVHIETDQPEEGRRVLEIALRYNPEDQDLQELANELNVP
jgi:tetratricopeptide (TPR) repeat protein